LFCGVRQPIGLWFSQRIFRTFEGPQRDGEVTRLIGRFRAEPVHYLVQSFRLNQFPEPVRVFWDDNYQAYRDSVFVAGRRLRGEAGQHSEFELLIAAPYRWLPLGNANTIRIDGERLALGEPPREAPKSFYESY